MKWNKPKKTIQRMILIISTASLLSSIVALLVFYIWVTNPDMVSKFDKKIPNYYENKIKTIRTKAISEKSDMIKYTYYLQLAKELNGITSLHKYYSFVQESNNFIINHHIKNNKIAEALNLSNEWQQKYPYDFSAINKYAEVLMLHDPNAALEYYETLNEKHPDNYKVQSMYSQALYKIGFFEKGSKVVRQNNNTNIKSFSKFSFNYYFFDKNNDFTEDEKILVENHLTNNNVYTVPLIKDFENLKGIRLDIEGIAIGSKIEILSASLNSNTKNIQDLKIKNLNHLIKIGKKLIVTGNDPHIIFDLPYDSNPLSGQLNIVTKLNVTESSKMLTKQLLQNDEWRIYYATNNQYTLKDSRIAFFREVNENTIATYELPEKTYKNLKLKLPDSNNFKIHHFKFKNHEVHSLHNVKIIDKDSYLVVGENPYMELKPMSTVSGNLLFSFRLSESL